MTFYQQPLNWSEEPPSPLINFAFPATRYQGSKRKLIDWIWENIGALQFDSALDVFGGTGVVSYLFKCAGKEVIYNDLLAFNQAIGFALIENRHINLLDADVERILEPVSPTQHDSFPDTIQRNFKDIYFTDEENAWLDRTIYRINSLLTESFKQAIARFALFQACIIKRPYNLFHRANLYMRTAEVERGFGNKTTWDTPFETHFRAFVAEANDAIFDNGRANRAIRVDALETPTGVDLVYIDPPYLNRKGIGVDYRDFYHFLEGIMNYATWERQIDFKSRHHRLQPMNSVWSRPGEILDAFDALFSRHRDSILVVSYRDDGLPTRRQLLDLLNLYKRRVTESHLPQKYVLSKSNSKELLLIAE